MEKWKKGKAFMLQHCWSELDMRRKQYMEVQVMATGEMEF
jgi:hypothetical protein